MLAMSRYLDKTVGGSDSRAGPVPRQLTRGKDKKSTGWLLHTGPAISFPSTNRGCVAPKCRMTSCTLSLTSSGHRETHLLSVWLSLCVSDH